MRRFINRSKKIKITYSSTTVSAKEIWKNTMVLVKEIQHQDFEEEIKSLQTQGVVKMTSRIKSLTPCIDEHGIVNVGGRIKNSELSDLAKHPILLGNKQLLTRLIMMDHSSKILTPTREKNSSINRQQLRAMRPR